MPRTREDVDLIRVGGVWIHRSVPALYQELVRSRPHLVNCYVKDRGDWKGTSVAYGAGLVRDIALGLADLGVGPGDRVGILANTRAEWGLVDLATLHLGAVTVGIYPTLLADEVAYIAEHAGVRVLVLEDLQQLGKVQGVRDQLPDLEHLVLVEGRAEGAMSLDSLQARGRQVEDGPRRFDEAWRAVEPDDLATIIYTSGTTGQPKGAMLTHGNLCYVTHASADAFPHREGDASVAFLPMAHALQRYASYVALLTRAVGYFNQDHTALMDDIKSVEPMIQVSVPRIWEKLHARLQEIVAGLPARRRRVFEWGLAVGREATSYAQGGEPLPLRLRLRLGVARRLVHDKLRAKVFGRRIRFLTSGGAPIDPEILEFFHALGLLVLEGWGLTETAAPATLNLPHAFKFGTVGRALAGTEVVVAEDGELLVRGPGVFKGYYRNDEATAEAFTEEGFFRTGDIGEVDPEGFVRITDRKKNLIILSGGKNIAPQKLENLFQTISLIGNALVHGDRRNYLVGLFTLDPEEVVLWACGQGLLPESARADAKGLASVGHLKTLLAGAELSAHIDALIAEKNALLPRFEQLKKWKVLPEVWTPFDGSLTPTLKLKRRVIQERHRELLDGMYG